VVLPAPGGAITTALGLSRRQEISSGRTLKIGNNGLTPRLQADQLPDFRLDSRSESIPTKPIIVPMLPMSVVNIAISSII
jgi:hypothetical protein